MREPRKLLVPLCTENPWLERAHRPLSAGTPPQFVPASRSVEPKVGVQQSLRDWIADVDLGESELPNKTMILGFRPWENLETLEFLVPTQGTCPFY